MLESFFCFPSLQNLRANGSSGCHQLVQCFTELNLQFIEGARRDCSTHFRAVMSTDEPMRVQTRPTRQRSTKRKGRSCPAMNPGGADQQSHRDGGHSNPVAVPRLRERWPPIPETSNGWITSIHRSPPFCTASRQCFWALFSLPPTGKPQSWICRYTRSTCCATCAR